MTTTHRTPGRTAIRAAAGAAVLALALYPGCAHMGSADAALAQAQAAYQRFLEENPPQTATAQYRFYYAQAETARKDGSYSKAIKLAGLAQKEAEEALGKRERLGQEVRKKFGWFRYQFEKVLHPAEETVDAYFGAQEALQKKDYEKAQSLYDKGMRRLEMDKATAFETSVMLLVPPSLTTASKGRIRVYSYIGEDKKLHDLKGELADGSRVTFMEKRYLTRDFQYYHIKAKDGALEGWVYPQFVGH